MGRRSATETIAGIFVRFLEQEVWEQKALADALGLTTKSLRARLDELCVEGVPLHRSEESATRVVWRMEPGWFPGSVRWTAREVAELIPVLLRAPQSTTRDAAIQRILRVIPRERLPPRTREAIEEPTRTTTEQEHEALVVDAALRRRALFVRYYSTERNAVSARVVSVQRVVSDAPVRFVGWCHERNELLWFRVDNVRAVRIERAEHFHEADPAEVERFVSESVEGFRQMMPVSCVFTVRDPEARWAQRNLPAARQGQYVIDAIEGGVRVQITTAGVVPLARWLVGLGAAGRAESMELAAQVEALARGALHEARR